MKKIHILMTLLCVYSYSVSKSEQLADRIDAYIQTYKNFSGAVLVIRDDQIIIKKAYGYANYEHLVPNSCCTKFRIASLTKCFTAFAIMQLVEKNTLKLTDPLIKFIPDFPHDNKITIHHLLTHTSGIPNYYKKWSDMNCCSSLVDIVNAAKKWPLEFNPSSEFAYSNTGYVILAQIIEKVTGKAYETFIQENILKPLSMHHTGKDTAELILPERAHGYVLDSNVLKNVPAICNPITLTGNGDLYSTIDDLYIWDRALSSEKIVSKTSLDTIFANHYMLDAKENRSFGYSWFIYPKYNQIVREFNGALRGFISRHLKFGDHDSIIIISNVEDENNRAMIFELSDGIAALLFDQNSQNKPERNSEKAHD